MKLDSSLDEMATQDVVNAAKVNASSYDTNRQIEELQLMKRERSGAITLNRGEELDNEGNIINPNNYTILVGYSDAISMVTNIVHEVGHILEFEYGERLQSLLRNPSELKDLTFHFDLEKLPIDPNTESTAIIQEVNNERQSKLNILKYGYFNSGQAIHNPGENVAYVKSMAVEVIKMILNDSVSESEIKHVLSLAEIKVTSARNIAAIHNQKIDDVIRRISNNEGELDPERRYTVSREVIAISFSIYAKQIIENTINYFSSSDKLEMVYPSSFDPVYNRALKIAWWLFKRNKIPSSSLTFEE